ncbi:MAG: protein kinase [Verrucomicrobiaceae bacterium]|nr:protein kinase [Verrucomicrobiaceae bacterium]
MFSSDPASSSSREKEIFMAALDVDDPAAQAAYLDSACDGDADLRARVERLLGLEADSRSFLQPPSMMRKGVEALEEPDFDATIQLAPAALPRQIVPPPVSASAANPDSPVPFIFGRRIAQGGMGAILEASDCKLGRTIAVKIMLSEAACSEDQKQRFIQEAAVLGRLEHPNIVPIHDLGRDSEGALYYTMKLVNGRTLQHILDDLRHEDKEALEHYTLDRLLTIFRKVCDALAFAHAQKIIHRDLKPENIMVGEFGEVLVMDWGIAKVLGQSDHETIRQGDAAAVPVSLSPSLPFSPSSLSATMEGAVMGTPQYMSPEQALGQVTDMDARSDIFSLGGILYAILTLRPPVEGKDVWEVIEKVSTARIVSPTTYGATTTGKGRSGAKGEVLEAKKITPLPHMPGGRVPNALSAVAMKALTLDKTKRYQDIAAFSADIEAFQGGFATTAEQAGLAKQIALLIKRNKGIFTTAAAAWLLITGLAVWFIFNLRAKERETRRQAEIAQQNEQKAAVAEAVAVQKESETSKAFARSQTSLAEAAYREFDSPAMLAALGSVPEDLRDADWLYLSARADNSQTALTFPDDNYFIGVAAHPTMPGVFAGALKRNTFVFVDALSGQRVFEFPGTERQRRGIWCRSLDFSPDGTRMVAGALGEGGVAIYETATGKVLAEWDAINIEWVCFSPDGTKTVELGPSGLVLHDATNGKTLWTVEHTGRAIFHPKGDVILVIGRAIRVLDTATGALIRTLPELREAAGSAVLSPDGSVLYLGCHDGVARGQRLTDGAIIFEQRLTESLQRVGVAISADGRRLLAVAEVPGQRRVGRVWDTATGITLQKLMGGTGQIENVAMHPLTDEAIITGPDTRTWALATRGVESETQGNPRASVFWSAEDVFISSDKPRKLGADGSWSNLRLPMPEECLTASIADAAGEVAAFARPIGNGSPVAIFRRTADGFELLHTVRQKTAATVGIRLSADGSRLVCFDPYKTAEVFDTATGQRLCEGDGKVVANFRDLNWIGADRILGIGTLGRRGQASAEERIFVWDAATGQVLRDVRNPFNADVLAVAPDGRTFAEGGENKRVRIRDTETLEVLREFRAHDGAITALAFHPTQPVLASGSADLTVRLWSLADNSLIEEMRPSTIDPAKLAFSPRGTHLASCNRRNRVSFFNLVEPTLGKFTRRSSMSTRVAVTDQSAQGKVAKEAVVAARSAAKKAPRKATKSVLPKDADGWEDILAPLTSADVENTGPGWSLKDGELVSPNATGHATLPLPAEVSGISYTVRLKLRQLPAKDCLHLVIPVADRMCGFDLEGRSHIGINTGLIQVNGKYGEDLPGVVGGKQVNGTEPHNLEMTVRLDGANATITATLDGKPLYEWTGPTATLSQHPTWATTEPGSLALGTYAGGWVVSEVKVKRLPTE